MITNNSGILRRDLERSGSVQSLHGSGPVLSLQRKAFPPLGSFLRLGGRGVGLLRDMRMHTIVSDLPDHQNPRPVLVSA